MALVGSGNVPDYPAGFDTDENRSTGDLITQEFQNDIQKGWTIIQQVLGLNPQGTYPSVVARLDAIPLVVLSKGTATIPNGQTTVTVTHGHPSTPTLADIQITPTNLPTNSVDHWYVVFAPTATTFEVRVRNDPGATGFDFAWQILTV